MRIPLSKPDITPADIEAVVGVLQTPNLSLGPKVAEFEQAVADYLECDYAVAVSSGTAALHLCLLAMELQPGDEVITTPFSFISSANCALMVGAVPVFVDIDLDTWNINPSLIPRTLTDRTRVILPVDVFGVPARMDVIQEIAVRDGLAVLEDACEALGARFMDAKAGTCGDAGVFGFYPNKQITTGEGGMVVTNQETLAMTIRSLRNQGRMEGGEWLQHHRLGYNFRLSDVNCALGISQMTRLDEILERRAQVAQWYRTRLCRDERIVFQFVPHDMEKSWFVMVVRLADRYTRTDRDRILNALRADGIGCSNYFAPIHLQPFYVEKFGYRQGDFPVCEKIAARTIALPFHTNLTENEVDEVCNRLVALL